MEAVEAGQAAVDGANELQVVSARKNRAKAICDILGPSRKAVDWTGEVESIETTLGGDDAILSIAVSSTVAIQTWNNSMSDFGDDTIIDAGTPLWNKIVDLAEGDEVRFSGQFIDDQDNCISESSLFDESGMATPDFVFRFSDVKKIG